MADPEQVAMLKRSVDEWNAWRKENREARIDLLRADLRNTRLAGVRLYGAHAARARLSGADLQNSDLSRTDLTDALLRNADLRHATLHRSTLCDVELSGSDLRHSDLSLADLTGADLSDTRLDSSSLDGAILVKTKLVNCHLTPERASGALFCNTDLSSVSLLEIGFSFGRLTVGADTLEATALGLTSRPDPDLEQAIVVFLKSSGLSEATIDNFRLQIGKPIEFYSCFISYNHNDKSYARRLYNELQMKGIRCWLDQHDMLVGDRIFDEVNKAIRVHDKVLLVCSFDSLTSSWVEDEIAMAFEKERKDGRDILIPLMLDDSLMSWESGKAARIRERLAADFTGWEKDNAVFEREFERVVKALRPKDPNRSDGVMPSPAMRKEGR